MIGMANSSCHDGTARWYLPRSSEYSTECFALRCGAIRLEPGHVALFPHRDCFALHAHRGVRGLSAATRGSRGIQSLLVLLHDREYRLPLRGDRSRRMPCSGPDRYAPGVCRMSKLHETIGVR
jgi:hypothetical protein